MQYFAQISWLAVFGATIVAFMLGGLWFSPMMFANKWMAALGKNKEDMGKPGPGLALTFVTTFVMALSLALVMGRMLPMSTIGAIRFGLVVGVGIVATGMASDYTFTGWPKTIFWIQASYHVVMLVVMSVIINAVMVRYYY
jgi:hypothetical protein